MPTLTFDTLAALRRRLTAGESESEIEALAEEYSIDDLKGGIQTTRGMLQAIAEDWTQDQLLFRPPDEEQEDPIATSQDRWSATEAVSHLVATQNWYMLHMGRLLGRRDYFEPMPRGLGDHARQNILKEVLAEMLREATSRFLAYIESIPADADWTLRRSSTFFGDLSLRGWVLLAGIHDVEHLEQIQRLAAMPTFPPRTD